MRMSKEADRVSDHGDHTMASGIRNMVPSGLFLVALATSVVGQEISGWDRIDLELKMRRLSIEEVKFKNLSVSQAVYFLEKKAAEADRGGRGVPMLVTPLRDAKEPVVDITLHDVSVAEALEYVCLASGYTYGVERGVVLVKPRSESRARLPSERATERKLVAEERDTRAYHLSLQDMERLRKPVGKFEFLVPEDESALYKEPFLKECLQHQGVTLAPDSRVSYRSDVGTLVVSSTAETLDHLESVLFFHILDLPERAMAGDVRSQILLGREHAEGMGRQRREDPAEAYVWLSIAATARQAELDAARKAAEEAAKAAPPPPPDPLTLPIADRPVAKSVYDPPPEPEPEKTEDGVKTPTEAELADAVQDEPAAEVKAEDAASEGVDKSVDPAEVDALLREIDDRRKTISEDEWENVRGAAARLRRKLSRREREAADARIKAFEKSDPRFRIR